MQGGRLVDGLDARLVQVVRRGGGPPGVVEAGPPQRDARFGARGRRAPQLVLAGPWLWRQVEAGRAQELARPLVEQGGCAPRGGELALDESADEDVRETQPVQRVHRRKQDAAGLADQRGRSLHAAFEIVRERIERDHRSTQRLIDRPEGVEVRAQRSDLYFERVVPVDGAACESGGAKERVVERGCPGAGTLRRDIEERRQAGARGSDRSARDAEARGVPVAAVLLGRLCVQLERMWQLAQRIEAGEQPVSAAGADGMIDRVTLDLKAAAIEEGRAQQLREPREAPVVGRQA